MRRVVVTGMGIVSSIGNNTQEVMASLREAKSGIVRADKYAELGFRCQVHGAPTLDPSEAVDRRAMRFLGGGAAWNHVAMEQAIRDAGLDESDVSNERTGIIMGSGGPSTRTIVESCGHHPQQGTETRRPIRGAKSHVLIGIGDTRDLVQDQGRQLFDLIGLRDVEPLYRQCLRTYSEWQAGHDVCRRLRRARLDAVSFVRRHGCTVVEISTTPRPKLRALTMPIATASSLVAAPAFWFWKNSSAPKRAVQESMPRSPVTAPVQTAPIW